MYNIYVSRTINELSGLKTKFGIKTQNNINLSTKTTNLIKVCTNLKKALKIGKFFTMKHKLSGAEM